MRREINSYMPKSVKFFLLLIAAPLLFSSIYFFETGVFDSTKIKIEIILGYGGRIANLSAAAKRGIALAYRELESGNIPIKIIYEEGELVCREAEAVYSKAVRNDGAKILIVSACSSATLKMARLAEKDKVILFTPVADADSISSAGDFIFRDSIFSTLEIDRMANYLASTYKRVVAVYQKEKDQTTKPYNDVLEDLLRKKGVEVQSLGIDSHGDNRNTVRSLVSKQDRTSIVHLILGPEASSTTVFIKQLREAGWEQPIASNRIVNSKAALDALGGFANGVLFAETDFDASTNPEFWEKYRGFYGEDPTFASAQGYEVLKLLAEIVAQQCRGGDTACIKDALYKVKNWPGASGLLTINAEGDAAKKIAIKQIRDGKVVKVE